MAQYTIELSDPEAQTIDRIAADTGRKPHEIVSILVRSKLFNVAVRNVELEDCGDENFQRSKQEQWDEIKRALSRTAPTLVYSRD